MARKHEHEEHVNTEAWAIPYGDLITLLLAFFVVMYAISSVNEGKYRVLSDSLMAAFRGQPHTMEPIPVGDKLVRMKEEDTPAGVKPNQALKFRESSTPPPDNALQIKLREMVSDLENAMQVLIDRNLIRIRREASWVEVEINTDILFPSGSAQIETDAVTVLERLAAILLDKPYPIRVEGHTDDRPIRTLQFPSNWELSAGRAARIVRLFEEQGVAPARLMVSGLGEYRPVADNGTPEGRNQNRRISVIILGVPDVSDGSHQTAPSSAEAAVPPDDIDATAPLPDEVPP